MDLIQILRKRIEGLDEGPYTGGLRAVLQHVQAAANHLKRGAETPDETAFTDAIYRTNQAFEGSLKEAYRVLAGKDPDKTRPYDIENFFQAQAILRDRVLEQMSRYRTEWRNPSTHDYKLDFDEDEALLAIVSVCAFAIVLIDQIVEKVSFDRAKAAAPPAILNTKPLADLVADSLLSFHLPPAVAEATRLTLREVHVVGAVGGHLEATLPPESKILVEALLGLATDRLRADIIVERLGERVLLEIKLTKHGSNIRGLALSQVSRYIAVSGIREAIVFIYDEDADTFRREDHALPGINGRIIVLSPGKPSSA
jgi:hypothetical protein